MNIVKVFFSLSAVINGIGGVYFFFIGAPYQDISLALLLCISCITLVEVME